MVELGELLLILRYLCEDFKGPPPPLTYKVTGRKEKATVGV